MFLFNDLLDLNSRLSEAPPRSRRVPSNGRAFKSLSKLWNKIIPKMPGVVTAGCKFSRKNA